MRVEEEEDAVRIDLIEGELVEIEEEYLPLVHAHYSVHAALMRTAIKWWHTQYKLEKCGEEILGFTEDRNEEDGQCREDGQSREDHAGGGSVRVELERTIQEARQDWTRLKEEREKIWKLLRSKLNRHYELRYFLGTHEYLWDTLLSLPPRSHPFPTLENCRDRLFSLHPTIWKTVSWFPEETGDSGHHFSLHPRALRRRPIKKRAKEHVVHHEFPSTP